MTECLILKSDWKVEKNSKMNAIECDTKKVTDLVSIEADMMMINNGLKVSKKKTDSITFGSSVADIYHNFKSNVFLFWLGFSLS